MVAELAHEYPPKIKYIVIPKRRYAVQSSHTNSNPYSYSPFSTSFDSNSSHTHNSTTNSFDTQQLRNRYLMLLEREKNRTESPSPPTTTSRLSTIFREASGGIKPGFPPVPLSSSYRSPLRIITIADRDRDNPSSIQLGSRKVESSNSDNKNPRIESSVESLLRKRRLGEYEVNGDENDRSREESWETKRFREEGERLAGLIDFIRRRDDSLAAITRGSAPIVDEDSDSDDEEEENDLLKADLLKYSSEWVADPFVHSEDEDEDEDEDDYNEEESDVIPYSIINRGNRENPVEESSGSELNEESEAVNRRNATNQIYRSTRDNNNSDSESEDDR